MPRLFLSYGRRDAQDIADRLKRDLEVRGYEVWLDTREIRAGADWQQEITDGLRSTQVLIALLSPHAVRVSADPQNPDAADSVCLDEISFARFAQPPRPEIVPVMVSPCEPPFCIFRLQHVDLCAWRDSEEQYQAGFKRLLDSIEAALRRETRYRAWEHDLKPWDFASHLNDKRRDFCGREWLFAEFDAWRQASGNERALLITGDPGTGKSAIVAQLVHLNPHNQVLAYHCCQADTPDTLEPARFIRSIAAMIASRLDAYAAQLENPAVKEALSESSCNKDPASALERGILAPLESLPAPENAPRCILVDALDEALTRKAAGLTIVDLLATRLNRFPGWLRVVATTRNETEILDRLRGLRARELRAQDPRNFNDLAQYIRARLVSPRLGEQLTESCLTTDRVIAILLEKSEGNFLYVQQALEGVERDLYRFDQLELLPPGLSGIYHTFFSRRFPDRDSFANSRRLLEVVIAAQEPLTESELAAATGMDLEEDLAETLQALAVYLPRQSSPDNADRFRLYHKSLADWLTDPQRRGQLHYASLKRGHTALSDFCWAQYQNGVATLLPYALAHLPAHLSATNRWGELERILTDYGFVETKVRNGMVYQAVCDFQRALTQLPAIPELINTWARFLDNESHILSSRPDLFLQQALNQPAKSAISRGAEDSLTKCMEIPPHFRWLNKPRDSSTSPLLRKMATHTGLVGAVALTPDGRFAISGSGDLTLKIWDASSGQEVKTLRGHSGCINAVICTPDGRHIISGSADKTIIIWDLESGRMLRTLDGHDSAGGYVNAVTITTDGRFVISASADKTIRVWDFETGQHMRTLRGHDPYLGYINSVAVTQDGRFVVSGSADSTVKVWDLVTGRLIRNFSGHDEVNGYVNAVVVTPDGRYAISGSADKTIKIWDIISGQIEYTLRDHTESVNALALTKEGRYLLSGSADKTLRIWDLSIRQAVNIIKGRGSLRAIAVTPDGRLAVLAYFGQVLNILALDREQEIAELEDHTDAILSIAISPINQLVISASNDTTIKIREASTGKCTATLEGHSEPVDAIVLTPDGEKLISASADRTLKIWELKTGKYINTLKGHLGTIHAVAVTPNGKKAISAGSDQSLIVWNVENGKCLQTLVGHSGGINAIAVTADGCKAVSGSWDKTLRIWSLKGGVCLTTLKEHTGAVDAVLITPDDKKIISASWDHTIRIWDLEHGNCLLTLNGHGAAINAVAITPDATRLVSASWDHTLKVWDIPTGKCLMTLEGHKGGVNSVAITSDGNRAVSGGLDEVLRVWQLSSGKCEAIFPTGGVVRACALVDDQHLVCGDESGRIYFLKMEVSGINSNGK